MSDLIYSTSGETNSDITGSTLMDSYGRYFPYLRLSITDVCNFQCSYCLPNGYQCSQQPAFITQDEIRRLVDVFADVGVKKVRLTGGEPTVRKDFTQIAQIVSSYPAVTQTAFTTNGYRLRDHAQEWRDAGLTHINISIDSLQAERFHSITGHDRLFEVLEGVEAAIDAGFERVKINVVLLKDINHHTLSDFLALAKSKPISIRFIELMQTGNNLLYFQRYHLPASDVSDQLIKDGWIKKSRSFHAGPAQEYSHPDYLGSMGFISPYSKNFCDGCNRLRVTSTGDLRLCLFGHQGVSLRHLLQDDIQKPLLTNLIQQQLRYKSSSHFLAQGDTGMTPHLASVGG